MSQNLLLDMVLSLDGTSGLLNQDKVYIHPHIPPKKLQNAINSYANNVKPENVMVLFDDTAFGGAKDGLIFTKDGLFTKQSFEKPIFIKLDNIRKISGGGLLKSVLNVNESKIISFDIISKGAVNGLCKLVESYIEKLNDKNNLTENNDIPSHVNNIAATSNSTKIFNEEILNKENLLLSMILSLDGTHSLVTQDKLYVHPNIPAKKIRNALESYVHNTKPEDIMVLLDDTLFGSGSDGVTLTKEGIFIKPNNSRNKYFFDIDCIKTIAADGIVLINLVINGSEKLPDFNQIGKSTLKAFCEFVTLYLRELRQVESNTVNIKTNQQNETKQTSSFNQSIVSDLNKKNIEPEKEIKIEKDLSKLTEDELLNEAELGNAEAQYEVGCNYYVKGGMSRKIADADIEFKKAVYWFKKAAEKNHSGAMSRLGGYYENGVYGVEKNIDKALELYQKAALLEDPSAQSRLGELYLYGKGGVTQSYDMAIEWFEKAFENIQNEDVKVGNKYSGINERLGDIYRHLGNYDKAIEWYEKYLYSYSSAEKVGNLYFELGNYEKALEYFTQPKIKQDSKYVVSNGIFSISGKLHLGIMYYDGKGSEQNHTIAFDYLEQAMDSFGNRYRSESENIEDILSTQELEEFVLNKDYFRKAQKYLDLVIDEYDGDEDEYQDDEDEGNESDDIISRLNNYYLLAIDGDNDAFKQLEKMARLGHYFAQYKLGIMYARGEFVERDPKEASKWIEKSASKGYPDAQFWKGIVFREVMKNDEEAIEWFLLAAEQGHMDAQFTLGGMYMNGRGVEQDIDEAFYWFNKAAKQGHEESISIVRELSKRYI